MSRKQRIILICHLCFAFTYMLWLFLQPPLKHQMQARANQLLTEAITTHEQFDTLPQEEQNGLTEHTPIQKSPYLPALFQVFKQTPPLFLAWLVLSLLLPIGLIFRIEGAAACLWLLPVMIAAQILFSFSKEESKTDTFFPSEQYVLQTYAPKDANPSFFKKRQVLQTSWHNYLLAEWATPEDSLDLALFNFNVARLHHQKSHPTEDVLLSGFFAPTGLLRFCFYLGWNLLVAWVLNKQKRSWIHSEVQSAKN